MIVNHCDRIDIINNSPIDFMRQNLLACLTASRDPPSCFDLISLQYTNARILRAFSSHIIQSTNEKQIK